MAKIFISYRQKESGYPADMIYEELAEHFGREQVFKDEFSIDFGRDYRREIFSALSQCQVMLVLIGEQWLDLKNKDGVRRLDEPNDLVRIEVETALERGIPVIPVLLDQTNIPQESDLPVSIRRLVLRRATRFRREERTRDCERIIAYLDRVLNESPEEHVEQPRDFAKHIQEEIIKKAEASPGAGGTPVVVESPPIQAESVDTKPNTETSEPGPPATAPALFKRGDRPLLPLDWELDTLLGRGGFGEVWKAINPNMPGQDPVALKFCTHPSAQEYFRNESKLISTVMHLTKQKEGFVALQNTYLNHAVPCLEYRYYPGGTLVDEFDKLRPGNLIPVERAHRIILTLSKILAHAHESYQPIVHRDLKPSNILRQVDKQGNFTLRITDFGISQFAAQVNLKNAAQASVSDQAVRLGAYTPLYASPQQKAQAPADPRDDIYALGVIWHQLLMSDRSKGAPTGDAWKAYLRDKRKVPEALIQLLSRCIDTTETARPRNAVELSKLLEHNLNKAVTPAAKPTAPPKKQGVDQGTGQSGTQKPLSGDEKKANADIPRKDNQEVPAAPKPAPLPIDDSTPARRKSALTVESKIAFFSGTVILVISVMIMIAFSNNILNQPLMMAVISAVSILGVVLICIGWYRYLIGRRNDES